MALENYRLNSNLTSLFDNVQLPTGIDGDTLFYSILEESAEFEVMYPDPDFLKTSIEYWFKKWYKTFEKWINAINLVYSPISDYSRNESWNEGEQSLRGVISNTADESSNTQNNTDNVTDSVWGYNSGTSAVSRETNNGGNTVNASSTGQSSFISNDNEDRTKTLGGTITGTSGNKSQQEMLEEEMKFAEQNIYKKITDMFLVDFCLMVY